MSWSEYKKKNGGTTSSGTSSSSWQQYKKKNNNKVQEVQQTVQPTTQTVVAPTVTPTVEEIAPIKTVETTDNVQQGLQKALQNKNLTPQQRQSIQAALDNYKANPTQTEKTQNTLNTTASQGGVSNIIGNNEVKSIKNTEYDTRSWQQKILQKPEIFEDNKTVLENVGDTALTVGGTLADAGLGFVKGIANEGEKAGDFLTYREADIYELFGNKERADELRRNAAVDIINKAFEKPQSVVNKASVLGSTGDKATEGMGYMATIWAASQVGGTLAPAFLKAKGITDAAKLEKAAKIGSTVMQNAQIFTSSHSGDTTNTYKKYDPAEIDSKLVNLHATGAAGIEMLSESLFGMFGHLDTKIVNAMANRAKTALGKVLTRTGLSAIGEGAEEFFSYAGNYVWDRVVDAAHKGDGVKFAEEWNWDEMWEEAGIAALTALGSMGGSTAVQTVGNKTNTNTWSDAINMTAEQQNKAAQAETIENDIKTLNKQLQKTTNPAEVQEIQNELNWKNKQLQALGVEQKTQEDIAPVKENVENPYKTKITEEINNSKLSEEDKTQFLNFIQNENITEDMYNDLKNNLNEVEKATIEANKLNTEEKYNTGRKEKYAQYMNDNSDYDTTDFDNIMEFVQPNYQGRRTKEQWLSIADELGKRISNKSNAEIEKIAYKTWQDTRPNAKENLNRQGEKFVSFNSDEWIDTVYNAANKARENTQSKENIAPVKENNAEVKSSISTNTPINLVESAKQYNLKYNDMNLQQVQKALEQKGIQTKFDDTEFSSEKEGAMFKLTHNEDGSVTREIILNPKADEKTVIQEMGIHELLHDIVAKNTETSAKLYDEVKQWLENDSEYKEQLNSLKEIYEEKLAEEEAIAKTLQTKFGTQEEINRLVKYKPNLARKFYDWVVEKLNNLTGGKIEKLFWEDVRNKFERAYNEKGNYSKEEQTSKRYYFSNVANFDEIEYNNIDSIKISSTKTWKSIKDEIDSAVKNKEIFPGVNEIELYDYGDKAYKIYTIYYKDIGDWKIIEETPTGGLYGENYETDSTSRKIANGDEGTRSNYNNNKGNNEQTKNSKTTARDVRLSIENEGDTNTNRNNNIEINKNKKYRELDESSSFTLPKNVKEISNLNEFIRKVVKTETSPYWLSQLKEAAAANYVDWTRRESRLQWKRGIIQQYLDYKNSTESRYSINTDGRLQDRNGKNVTLEGETGSNNKTLLAIHNLTADKLKGILELGGFPVPSIAITNQPHTNFGNISVIFNKNTIDPSLNKANKVYSRDAYTARTPNVVNKLIESGVKEVAKNTGLEEWYLKENYKEMSIENAVEKLRRNENILDKYLQKKGIEVEPVYRDFKGFTHLKQDSLQNFINTHEDLIRLNYTDKYTTDTYKKYYKDVHNLFVEDIMKEANISREEAESFYKDYPGFNHWDYFIKDLDTVQKLQGKQQLDEYATKDAKEKAVDVESKEYKDFVKDLISPMYGEKYIRNNKDYYTPSGTPRSFNQRYEEYTLDNIVKIMNENKGTGQESTFGVGITEIAGDASKRFKSIEDIKNNENLLVTQNEEEHKQTIDKYNKEFRDIESSILDKYSESSIDGYVWREKAIEDAMKNIARKMSSNKKITIQNVISQFDTNGIQINENQAKRVIDLIKNLSTLPTNYFEAKPQRAVGFDEIDAVVLPSDTDASLKQQLKDLGINTIEYNSENENERAEILKSLNDYKFSKTIQNFDEYIANRLGGKKGTRTTLGSLKETQSTQDIAPVKKTMNPTEIAEIAPTQASTTPKLPTKKMATGNKESKFFTNVTETTQSLSKEARDFLSKDDNIKYYQGISNEQTLGEAYDRLQKGGTNETLRWISKDSKQATADDVAEGWILLKQYQDAGDYDSMVEVAKKMRDIGTEAGQTVQAFNMLSRLTPEGMVKYVQSQLLDSYNEMIKNKTKDWIDNNRDRFELTADETEYIVETMKKVAQMEDGYDKKVELAKIQKIMNDKLPPEKGAKIKSWMRISMLFNPKTQVRNVAGNTLIVPVNDVADVFASLADRAISKYTGKRTTGMTNIAAKLEGFKRGAIEATNDYRLGINTKEIDGNRFEIGEGKSFSEKNAIGRALNRTESMLNYVMDVGDRVFSQAAFENSIKNQMKLNNTTEVTQEMIDIATQESLQRTWNDNNNYTKTVLKIRSALNDLVNIRGYGLGDVLIPFAKTPANLTKAIVDYSPAGLVNTLTSGIELKRSLKNGQYNAQMQHRFVQNLGKATAGTMLYVLAYALAKAKIITGKSDEDKDTANFLKNTLGVSGYSIKIGDKTFTYDWAQPIAAPFSIMANIQDRKDKGVALLEGITGSLDTAGSILLEQSFLQSINDVLSDNDGIVSGLINEALELPARAVPTFSKQIADMVDGTQRQTFVYDNPLKSALNNLIVKIPGASTTLAPAVDTMGREIQKYGGKNNVFNVFLNPANVNTENISTAAQEIYDVYKATGDKTIMPRVAPYYIDSKGNRVNLTPEQRAEYQKVSGKIIEDSVDKMLKNPKYVNATDTEKAAMINDIVNYSYNIAKKEVLNLDTSKTYDKAYEYSKIGNVEDFYVLKNNIVDTNAKAKRQSILNYFNSSKLTQKQKVALYKDYFDNDDVDIIYQSKIDVEDYIRYLMQDITADKDSNGKSISGTKKSKVIDYVNSLDLSVAQKAILIKATNTFKFNDYNNEIVDYVSGLNISYNEKVKLLKSLDMTVNSDGSVSW